MGRIYYQKIEITDFGPYVTKIILPLNRRITFKSLNKNQFFVYVQICDKNGELVKKPLHRMDPNSTLIEQKGYRSIKEVYPSDIRGNRLKEGNFITLSLNYGPLVNLSSAISADFSTPGMLEYYTVHDYMITQTADIQTENGILSGLVFDHCAETFNDAKSRFVQVKFNDKNELNYGYFIPQRKGSKKPLIVFLHGAGEGGQDLPIAYSGNKVTALTEKHIQDIFDGAYVLVPQCPTVWMNDGQEQMGKSGQSIYVESLMKVIKKFIANNSEGIDMDRIYIGGDSNGGFMTLRMLIDYPDFFTAGFPICEALYDKSISDQEIDTLKDIPLWFVHAKNDPIVIPEEYVLPTYRRLKKAGAKNLHFTFWDKIVDMHGMFKDKDGNPYEYLGHFAWIPVFNDDCKNDFDGMPVIENNKEVSLFEWLAMQTKNK